MKTYCTLENTTTNLPENQERKPTCLWRRQILFNRKKLDNRSIKQKHSGQHGQNIYPKIICIIAHQNL